MSEKQRGETVRENRGYYCGSAVGCVSSFCWIIERKDWLFGVDVGQTGWTTYICVSLVLCILCVYISIIFYVFHCSVIYNFLTEATTEGWTWRCSPGVLGELHIKIVVFICLYPLCSLTASLSMYFTILSIHCTK